MRCHMSYFKNKYWTYNKINKKLNKLYGELYFGKSRYNYDLNMYYHAIKSMYRIKDNPTLFKKESYRKAINQYKIQLGYLNEINNPRINIIKASEKQSRLASKFGKNLIRYLSTLLECRYTSNAKIILYKPLIAPCNGHLEHCWGLANRYTGEIVSDDVPDYKLHEYNPFKFHQYKPHWTILNNTKKPIIYEIHKGILHVVHWLNSHHNRNPRKYPLEIYEMPTEFIPSRKSESAQTNFVNVHSQGLAGSTHRLSYNEREHWNSIIRKEFCKVTDFSINDVYTNIPEMKMRNGSKEPIFLNYLDCSNTQRVLPVPVRHKMKKKTQYEFRQIKKYNHYLHKQQLLPQLSKKTKKKKPITDYELFKHWKYNKAFVIAAEHDVHGKIMRCAINPKLRLNSICRHEFKSGIRHLTKADNIIKIADKHIKDINKKTSHKNKIA